MNHWNYCRKQGKWIENAECPEPDCPFCAFQEPMPENSWGDGDSWAREDIDDYPSDAEAASVTVHIPETDQSCHFGPDWDADDDETLTFLEMSWEELFAEEDPSEEADEDRETSENEWEAEAEEGEESAANAGDWECDWSEGEGGDSSGGSGEGNGGEK